jgi:hypothetical protein
MRAAMWGKRDSAKGTKLDAWKGPGVGRRERVGDRVRTPQGAAVQAEDEHDAPQGIQGPVVQGLRLHADEGGREIGDQLLEVKMRARPDPCRLNDAGYSTGAHRSARWMVAAALFPFAPLLKPAERQGVS